MPDSKVTRRKAVGKKEDEQLKREIDSLKGEIREMKEIVNMLLNMVIDTDDDEEYPGVQFPDFEERYGPNN